MTSPHPYIADGFCVTGIIILIVKFWAWEESKHDTTRKTAILLAGGTLFLLTIGAGLCVLSNYLAAPSVTTAHDSPQKEKPETSKPKPTEEPPQAIAKPSLSQEPAIHTPRKPMQSSIPSSGSTPPNQPGTLVCSAGASCAQSTGQTGGITAGTVNLNPPVNPNQPVTTYSCDGQVQRILGSSPTSAMSIGGCMGDGCPAAVEFQKMAAITDPVKLRLECLAQTKETPEWLSPYLFCGVADIDLGMKVEAGKILDYYQQHTGPAYKVPQCDAMLDKLRKGLERP